MSKREQWVDRLKFWGMLAIYIGHFYEWGGWLYEFVFTYHVPLFFFVSGFFANCSGRYTTGEYIKKKVNTLVIPYLFLGLLNIVFGVLLYNLDFHTFLLMFKSFSGIRSNMDYFGSMWFFPCLFFMEVLYELLYRVFRSRRLLVFVSVLFYALFCLLKMQAHILLSLDCVLLYFIYFALGSLLYKYIKDFEVFRLSAAGKAVFGVAVICSVVLACLTFFQKGHLVSQVIYLIKFKPLFLIALYGWDIAIALNMIFVSILIAKYWKWGFLGKLGSETLIFCGTEWIIKDGLQSIVEMLGGTCNLENPFQVVAFSMSCLVISHFTITALLKRSFPRLVGEKTICKTGESLP